MLAYAFGASSPLYMLRSFFNKISYSNVNSRIWISKSKFWKCFCIVVKRLIALGRWLLFRYICFRIEIRHYRVPKPLWAPKVPIILRHNDLKSLLEFISFKGFLCLSFLVDLFDERKYVFISALGTWALEHSLSISHCNCIKPVEVERQ